MRRLFYIVTLATLFFASCEKDNFQTDQPEEVEYGTLLLGDANISVSTETDVKDTRAESEGSPYDNYIIKVTRTDVTPNEVIDLDKGNPDANHITYDKVKTDGISLPAGTYTLKIQSSAVIPSAEFESPVYTAEETGIVITAGDQTTIEGNIVCKLNEQVKVGVTYNVLFKEHIAGAGNAVVTIGQNQSLNYPITYDESTKKVSWKSENGFFKVQPNPTETTMEVSVDVKMKVKKEGSNEYETKDQKMTSPQIKVKACQWRKIEFQMTEDKNGTASFSIKIGDLEEDIPLTAEVTTTEEMLGSDPTAPKSDGDIRLLNIAGLNTNTMPTQTVWNDSFTFGNPSYAPTAELKEGEEYTDMDIAAENTIRDQIVIVIDDKLTKGENDAPKLQFQAVVPGKIQDFKIKIISDIIDETALIAAGVNGGNELDIINRPEEVVGIATFVPFPYEGKPNTEDGTTLKVKGETKLDFILDDAIPLLQELIQGDATFHEHTFQMIVKDEENRKKVVNLKLKVVKPSTSSN